MSRLEEREAQLRELTGRLAGQANSGESVEAYAVHTVGTSVSVFDGAIERLTNAEARGVGVRVIVGGHLGFAATSDVSDDGLAFVLEEARSNADYGTPDLGNVLPEPPSVAPEPLPDAVDETLAEMPVERKVALALELERLTTGIDPRVSRVEAASYGDAWATVAITSSTGLAAATSRTQAWAFVSALAQADADTQTAFGFTLDRGLSGLDIETAARDAVTRATRLLGAHKPATTTVPVVFDPLVTAAFVGVVGSMLSAEAVQKGRSLFAGLVGEAVAGQAVTLVDDGRIAGGPSSAPFDDEGMPTMRTPLIEAGVLQGYLHNTATAARDDAPAASTGNATRAGHTSTPTVAPTNLLFEGEGVTPEAVLRRAGTGLYVQQASGVHSGVNPISGEFSVGATGLWIRDGQLAEPVRELTVSGTLLDMLRSVVVVGDDRRFVPFGTSVAGCTLLLDGMRVAGS
jgi:PmbA protein